MLSVALVPLVASVLIALALWASAHGETNLRRHGNRWRTPAHRRTDKLNRMQARVDRYADRNGLK